jgi:hypothetical protein
MGVNEIDWSKPVEALISGKLYEVTAAMCNNDGSLRISECGMVHVLGPVINTPVHHAALRNKLEPLEIWVNVYPGERVGNTTFANKREARRQADEDVVRHARMVEVTD